MSELLQKCREIESQMANHMNNLRNELEMLQAKLHEEQRVAQRAAAMGDRSENAELQIAKDNIARYTVSIMSLMNTLATYDTYRTSYVPTGRALLGSTLKIRDCTNGAVLYIKLYPAGLGNAKIGAVTVATPLGVAVLGKPANTEVVARAPIGEISYYIEEVL